MNGFQIFAYERLAARKVYELQLRQRLKVCRLDLLLPVGRVLPDVAHLATHRTTVRQNDACVSRTRICHYCLFIYQYFVVIFVYEAYFLEICSPYRAYFAVLCSLCGYLYISFQFQPSHCHIACNSQSVNHLLCDSHLAKPSHLSQYYMRCCVSELKM